MAENWWKSNPCLHTAQRQMLGSGFEKKSQTFSRVRVIIEDELINLPEAYSQELASQKGDELFLYMRERYSNDGSTSVA